MPAHPSSWPPPRGRSRRGVAEVTAVTIHVPHKFSPRSYQLPLLRHFERGGKKGFCAWHRRSGKGTMTFAGVTIPKMLERVGLYLHTFPIAAQALARRCCAAVLDVSQVRVGAAHAGGRPTVPAVRRPG